MIAEPIEPFNEFALRPSSQLIPLMLADGPAKLNAAQILAGMRHRFDRLAAFEVECDFVQKSFQGDDKLVPFGRSHYAFSGHKRFSSQSGQHLENSPCIFPHAVSAWNGTVQQRYQTFDKSAYLEAEKDDWVDFSFYLNNAAIPIGSVDEEIARLRPSCQRTYIFELFEPRRSWKVLPELEIVDDAICHVLLDSDQLKLWIDPELGFAVRLLEYSWGKIVNGRRQILSRTEFRDFRSTRGDFYASFQINMAGYDRMRNVESPSGELFSISNYNVRKVAANSDVDDELFTLKYPLGTVVRDKADQRFYRVGDNDEQITLGDCN